MARVYSKALNTSLETDRIIGQIDGKEPGPCLIFIGGLHGNEPSGVFALHHVVQALQEHHTTIRGSMIALAGNLWALERTKRFHKKDLNRLWNTENMECLKDGTFVPSNEDEKQQESLYRTIQNILATKEGPFYFFDLHTTSSSTSPFLTVSDNLPNRKFARQYPLPMIVGIEAYLDGPLLSYIQELGHVSFGFESGQHDDRVSLDNHIAFVYLSLVLSGVVDKESIDYSCHFQTLNNLPRSVYEIYFRYEIKKDEKFVMKPGFTNFQRIHKGELLAESNEQPIRSPHRSIIFMPLYQPQGDDGFFMIRLINEIDHN